LYIDFGQPRPQPGQPLSLAHGRHLQNNELLIALFLLLRVRECDLAPHPLGILSLSLCARLFASAIATLPPSSPAIAARPSVLNLPSSACAAGQVPPHHSPKAN
jgi:hypothetical protein